MFGYVRGQILFSLIMGASAALSLYIFGLLGHLPGRQDVCVFFGAFYGLMEFIPYIGPIIGPLPAVLVALFNDPISAVWVIILFIALQQLEGHLVAPQVFRISLRINPILIILWAADRLSALWDRRGAGRAAGRRCDPPDHPVPPAPSGARAVGRLHAGTGDLAARPGSLSGMPRRTGPDDQFCRVCGASLEPRVRTPG